MRASYKHTLCIDIKPSGTVTSNIWWLGAGCGCWALGGCSVCGSWKVTLCPGFTPRGQVTCGTRTSQMSLSGKKEEGREQSHHYFLILYHNAKLVAGFHIRRYGHHVLLYLRPRGRDDESVTWSISFWTPHHHLLAIYENCEVLPSANPSRNCNVEALIVFRLPWHLISTGRSPICRVSSTYSRVS